MYKFIGHLVRGGAIANANSKVNISDKLNLKSSINDDNEIWEKYVKFNEDVTVFSVKSMVFFSNRISSNKIVFRWKWMGGYTSIINEVQWKYIDILWCSTLCFF